MFDMILESENKHRYTVITLESLQLKANIIIANLSDNANEKLSQCMALSWHCSILLLTIRL